MGHLAETVAFSAEKSVLVWHRENRAHKIRAKPCPQIRPFESDAATYAETLEATQIRPIESDAATAAETLGASEPCRKGCTKALPPWF